jgi:beta-lactamase regulating signal transducer with metallopeptidase domain
VNLVSHLMNDSVARRLGWALLHSIWQGALGATMLALLVSALRRHSANARYMVACAMLCAVAAAPAITFFYSTPRPVAASYSNSDVGSRLVTGLSGRVQSPTGFDGSGALWRLAEWTRLLDPLLPWLVIAWIAGVLIFCGRWLQGYWWTRRMRVVQTAPLDADWRELLEDLKVRFQVSRRVGLVSSALADVPMVIGWLRPVIVLPASSLTGLAPAQLEAILAHELAHVRRCDCLVNVFQNLIETVMFYHPAVWWISRCIRQERELCCDDMVVRVCRDRFAYARALFRLEELRGAPARLAFAASGGSLLSRIRRLVAPAKAAGPITAREFGGLAVAAIGCLLALLGGFLLMGPEAYSSRVRMKIEHNPTPGVFSDPWFVQTEFEVIQSEVILGKVIEDLNLDREWSRKYGRVLKAPESMALLRRQMEMRPVRNTSIIELQVYDPDAARAAEIANKIADTYRDFRKDETSGRTNDHLEVLMKQLKEQEAAIAELRNTVEQQGNLLKSEDNSPTREAPRLSAEALRKMEELRIENLAEYQRSKALLDQLKALPPEELAQDISTAGIQDGLLNQLVLQMALARQKQASLAVEYGPQHPEVRLVSTQISDLQEKINSRTRGLIDGLALRVESLGRGLTDLSNEVSKATQSDILQLNGSRNYSQAKRDLEEQQEIHKMLLMKIATEKADVQLPRSAPVQIVDRAFPASRPATPNRPRAIAFIATGTVLAVLGLLLARKGQPGANELAAT